MFQRHLLDRAVGDDPGVVNQHVQAPAFIRDLFHHCLDLAGLGDVALDHDWFLQIARYVFGVRFVSPRRVGHIINDALRAMFPKRLDHLRANPAGTAGDERNFAGEIE